MQRITRKKLFTSILDLFEQRSTCERGKVAALIIKDKRIISTGYNGSAPGSIHCGDHCDLSKPCNQAIHAEVNAIAYASKIGISLNGSTLLCSMSPCINCTRLIIQSGIKFVYFKTKYRDSEHLTELLQSGIIFDHIKDMKQWI